MKNERLQRLLAAALAVAVWQAASMAVGSSLLLASPVQVAARLAALLPTAAFWQTIFFSLLRIAGGFLLALVLAAVLALAAGRLRVVEILLQPYVLAIKSVPVASFIILALIWLKTSHLSLFISFLMVFPALYTNILVGIKSADGQLLEMAQVFRVPWKRRHRPRHELEGRRGGGGHRRGERLHRRAAVRRENLPANRRSAGVDGGHRGHERRF